MNKEDIITARRCMKIMMNYTCDNQMCKNESCPLNPIYHEVHSNGDLKWKN